MNIDLELCRLRPFRHGDQADLVRHANNPNVTEHLRERFPQPYTWADAEAWIARVAGNSPALDFAICIEDHAVGGISFAPGSDSQRVSAEVGYWLGEAFWGRGIGTCALSALVSYAFGTLPELNRLFAHVDEDHPASIRVLEKARFRREGHLIGSAIKRGKIRNQYLYAITRAEAKQVAKANRSS